VRKLKDKYTSVNDVLLLWKTCQPDEEVNRKKKKEKKEKVLYEVISLVIP